MTESGPDLPEVKRSSRLSRMSRASLVATLLLGAVALGLFFVAPKPPPPSSIDFDLQGHRGARGLAAENTLPGFETALALGVTTLEMDVGLTADSVAVALHDRRLSPDLTRGPDGAWLTEPGPAVVDLDLAALRDYQVGRARPGSRTAERFPEQSGRDGVPIPKLSEVLALAERRSGGQLRYNIETKISPLDPATSPDTAAIVQAIVADLKAAGALSRASLQSFDWRSLILAQDIAPALETVYLTVEQQWLDTLERGRPGASPWTAGIDIDAFEGSVPAAVVRAGGRVWSPYFRDLRDGDLAEAKALGLRVVVWTVNDPEDMRRLLAAGVDGIITDYPDRLRQVMAAAGLPLPPRFPLQPAAE